MSSLIHAPQPLTRSNYTPSIISKSNSYFSLLAPSIVTIRAVRPHWLVYIFTIPQPVTCSLRALPGSDSFALILTPLTAVSLSYSPGTVPPSCSAYTPAAGWTRVKEIIHRCCGHTLHSRLFSVLKPPTSLSPPLLVDNPASYLTEMGENKSERTVNPPPPSLPAPAARTSLYFSCDEQRPCSYLRSVLLFGSPFSST